MMRFIFPLSILVVFLSLTVSCRISKRDDAANVIVTVGEHQLTREDLNQSIGSSLSAADSIRLANAYVKSWIEEILLFEKAKENIDRLDEINREAEDYKRRMVIFEYQKRLVNERVSTELTDAETEQFYQLNRRDFILQQPIVKGLFLKVPADAPQLNELKKWMKKVDGETLEKIEKYSLQNALVYEYFLDRWEPMDELMKNIPYDMANRNRFIKEKKSVEVTQDGYWYYLYIQQYVASGEVQPYEYARERIREALLNQKKKDFIRSVEDELYKKALEDRKIKYYSKEPKGSE